MKEDSGLISHTSSGSTSNSSDSPQSLKKSVTQSSGFEQVRDRKDAAATSVLSGGDNAVSEVLEKARAIADDRLAEQKDEVAQEIADELVVQEMEELTKLRDFFKRYRTGEANRMIAPYREYLEAEILE